jgi:S1-C subfamily serine protease
MTYEVAEAVGANVTYGWLIAEVTDGGPADEAGLRGGMQQVLMAGEYVTVGGDIVVAIDETRITSMDDLSTYLEEHTLPDQTVNVGIVRDNQALTIVVKLGTRPSQSTS